MAHGKFGTAINCMDGRTQLPLINWMKEKYHLDYVDMITEPGVDKIMSTGHNAETDRIKAKVGISVNKHGSSLLVIAGHDDCAGNPVEEIQHRDQLIESMGLAHSWDFPLKQIAAVWMGKDWKVQVVSSLE